MARSRYTRNATITPGTPVPAGDAVFFACTVAGNVRVKLDRDTLLDVLVDVGSSLVEGLAVKDVIAGGATTATVVVSALYEL